jgi:hypothetical protein
MELNGDGEKNIHDDLDTLSDVFSRAIVKPELAAKNDYVKNAVKKTGVDWMDIARRPTFHNLQYGSDFQNWVTEEVKRRSNINPSSSFSSRSIGGIHKGGKKSRRNTRRRKYSKKQKPSRKQTRRHRHRRSRHRR